MISELQSLLSSNSISKLSSVSCKEVSGIQDDESYKQLELKKKSLELSNIEENILLNRKLTELLVKNIENGDFVKADKIKSYFNSFTPFVQKTNCNKIEKPQEIQDDDDDIIELKNDDMEVSSLPVKLKVLSRKENKPEFYLTTFIPRKLLYKPRIKVIFRSKIGYCKCEDCEFSKAEKHRHYLIKSSYERHYFKKLTKVKNYECNLIESQELLKSFVKKYDLIFNKH